MPKRVIDGEALWSSSKLMQCAAWAKAEYAWLYPLADGNGSFELTNLRVIHGKVAAIRPEWTEEQLRMTLSEFRKNGLLFAWKQGGKLYGHWTGSNKPGRLPSTSERARYQIFAPPVPKDLLSKYLQQYRDKIAMLSRQYRDLDLDWDREKEGSIPAVPDAQPEKQASRSIPQPQISYEGTHLRITEKQDQLLAQAFPWIERREEYARADSWLEANPERRPKKQARFIDNWFRRIKKGDNSNGARSSTPSREDERHERSQQAIETVLGHRSGLAERLRDGLQGTSHPGTDARVHGVLGARDGKT